MKRTRGQAGFGQGPRVRKYRRGGARTYQGLPRNLTGPRRAPYRLGAPRVYGVPPSKPELKFIETSMDSTSYGIGGTGNLLLINNCVQGSDADDRLGRKATFVSFQMRCAVTLASTAVTNGLLTRTILFVDNQTNGLTPAITDLLTSNVFESNMNLNNRDRFTILMDKVLGGTGGDLKNHGFKKFKKISVNTTFNQLNGGNVGDIQTGSLYLLTFLGTNCVTVTAPVTTGRIRLRFMDN